PASAPLKPPSTATYTDPDGQTTTYQLNADGHLLGSSDDAGSNGTLHRDPNLLVTQKIDARGNVTLYTYDDAGDLVSVRDTASSDSIVRGSVSKPGERHVYTFSATAGDSLYYDAIGTISSDLDFSLYNPDGTTVQGFFGGQYDSGIFKVSQTG